MNRSILNRKMFGLTSLIAVAMMILAACSPSAYQSTAPAAQVAPAATATTAPMATAVPAATATAPAPAASEPTISVATDAKLGKILVDGKGMTLYVFTKDVADKSNCAGGCAKAWPPLLTMGSPKAGDGVDASMLGSAALADGTKIVTYNHMPLYYFAKDSKAGDTTGQGVGTVWFTVSPSGQMVKDVQVPATGATSATDTPAAASSTGGTVVNVATDAKLGKILVDGKGMTLYIYTKDTPDTSTCSGGCAKAWPPFVAAGSVTAGAGVDQSKLGTAALADGSKIVTYNHMPLYYWKGDMKPGDTSGQGVGSVWFVIGPDGNPIKATASAY